MRSTLLLLCFVFCSLPIASLAETPPSLSDENIMSSTSTTHAVMVGVEVLAMAAMTSSGAMTTSSLAVLLVHNAAIAKLYLKENAPAVAQDMALGAGQSLNDLGVLAGVEPRHQRAFAKAVSKQRRGLLPLLNTDAAREVCVARIFAIARAVSA